MKQAFWEVIGKSFGAVQGPILSVLSFLVSIIGALTFTTWVAAVTAIVCSTFLIALFTFIHASYKCYKDAANPLPRILYSSEPGPNESAELVCLLEPSELFSHGILVSFYHVGEHGREVLIGVGVVENVQTEDGKILVALTYPADGYQEEVDKLKRNDAVALQQTRVKPNAPRQYLLRSILQGGS